MSIKSGFFNSINHDRQYTADDMSEMFNGLFSDGIFKDAVIQDGYETNDAFIVEPYSGMGLSVGTGKAWFNKVWVLNDSKTGIIIPNPHLFLTRIDAVIIEVNKKDRDVEIKVISGEPAADPQKPELRKGDGSEIYQYALAYITVNGNVTEITSNDIENVVGTEETPYVSYIGGIAPGITVVNNCTTREPGYILDARQGKFLYDQIPPIKFGISGGKYGYYNGSTFVPFLSDNVVNLGSNISSKNLSSYSNYKNFRVNKNIFLVPTGMSVSMSGGNTDHVSPTANVDSWRVEWYGTPATGESFNDKLIHSRSWYDGRIRVFEHVDPVSGSINPSVNYNSSNGILSISNTSSSVTEHTWSTMSLYNQGGYGVPSGWSWFPNADYDDRLDVYRTLTFSLNYTVYLIY